MAIHNKTDFLDDFPIMRGCGKKTIGKSTSTKYKIKYTIQVGANFTL